MEFDHAGLATDDADALAELYTDLLDAPIVHRETFDGMSVVFLDCGNGYFELLEPLDDDSAIAKYLDRNGPGIHHLALETDNVVAALDRAREHDVELIDDEPRPGAWGHSVAFLHPGSTGGVLIEFVEH
ncbi:methylmalonyl-CoA epimerase [Halococcus saccharolyticus]|uniref:Methylmalonyl-CoA epimerase n=1 Tax=Halococcus saccharolyticus DSM 5350 TaxID=1227455 RepID=M0MP05_9EURY|nr:methylmalonyl-CoA epimerase [Halococcus saccharolyticus]EMA46180.1 methylmalonyl-CoA epimerase [Halococcus saccharolyticus DSM 5350]